MVKVTRETRQKQVLQNILDSFSSFFSAQEIHAISSLPLATIYRYLKTKVDSAELFSYRCGGKTIYSTKRRSHCHYICEKSGKVIHFDIDSLDFLKNKIPGEIESFQIEVRGICTACEGEKSC